MINKEYRTDVTYLCGHKNIIMTLGYKPSERDISKMKKQKCPNCYMANIYDDIGWYEPEEKEDDQEEDE